MSRLSALCGRTKEIVELDDGITVELRFTKTKFLPEFAKLTGGKADEMSPEKMNAMIMLLKEMVQDSDPEATDAEVEEIVITYMPRLMEGTNKLIEKIFSDAKVPTKKNKEPLKVEAVSQKG